MKLAALLVFAAVLVAGCVQQPPQTLGEPPAEQPPAAVPPASIVNIAITDAGFSPASVTVSVGDTVTWTNQADRAAWPASDDHPTHTRLPGFDSLRGLAKGESYSFRFTQPGTWGYHDHLRPSLVGTVIVGRRL